MNLATPASAFSAPIPDNDAERLATLYRYAILDTPHEQGYEDATALASYICGTPYSTITLVDAERQWFKSEIGFGTNETGRSEGFCACALLNPEPMIVEDTLLDPRFAENAFVLGPPHIRFYAGAPLVAPNGHILGTVCVFDTKPRQLSAEQVEALVRLARQVMALLAARLSAMERERAAAVLLQNEKLAAVGRLAASMAHAINNPLEAVTNLLFLTRSKMHDDEVNGWLDQADLELRRVAVIANQTLRFHKQSSRRTEVTCLDLFAPTLDAYQARINNAFIAVEKRKRANQCISCFEGDMRQVLGSVVANAIDAMPRGGTLTVRSRDGFRWRDGRPCLVLTIADTGTGMDRETRSRAFEAFFSTKGIGGSGLGLWISNDIMRRHNGSIRMRSSPHPLHHGTVVQLFLPVEAVRASAQ